MNSSLKKRIKRLTAALLVTSFLLPGEAFYFAAENTELQVSDQEDQETSDIEQEQESDQVLIPAKPNGSSASSGDLDSVGTEDEDGDENADEGLNEFEKDYIITRIQRLVEEDEYELEKFVRLPSITVRITGEEELTATKSSLKGVSKAPRANEFSVATEEDYDQAIEAIMALPENSEATIILTDNVMHDGELRINGENVMYIGAEGRRVTYDSAEGGPYILAEELLDWLSKHNKGSDP